MCLLLAWFSKNHSAVWLVCCAESWRICFGLQHLAVDFGFALECQGIGAAAAGHAIQAHGALVESEVDPSAYGWFAQAEMLAERCGGFLSGGDYCPALGQLAQEADTSVS